MLIESDRHSSKIISSCFTCRANIYLIGLMNMADRSLAMLDHALPRRFAFLDLGPAFASDGFVAYRGGPESDKFNGVVTCVARLNAAIASDEPLGEGFCVGCSYFCGLRSRDMNAAGLSASVGYELILLLGEHRFNEPSKVREWSDALCRVI